MLVATGSQRFTSFGLPIEVGTDFIDRKGVEVISLHLRVKGVRWFRISGVSKGNAQPMGTLPQSQSLNSWQMY
jgi:hypothetical protein